VRYNGDSIDLGGGQGEDVPGIKQSLAEHSHVFRDIPDHLLPIRHLEHEIDIGVSAPVNIQAYALSNQKEQMKQSFWRR
jgi:hypothetical protein